MENYVLGIAFTGDVPQKIKFEDHVKSIEKNLKKKQQVNDVISHLKEYFESLVLDTYERLNFKVLFTWIVGQVTHITEIAHKNSQWEYYHRNKRNVCHSSDPDHSKKFLEITRLKPRILQINISKNEERAKAICEQFISYVSKHDDECGMGIQMVCISQNDFKWIKAPKGLSA
ncbi:MAG: hypothetical protein JSW11_09180 [Candidatus Heimdallarchaeota archaeon]|nr:MAG: hypothetical protein JSW11_09180 [Candidatus Heimdallarchaeota archaeon]